MVGAPHPVGSHLGLGRSSSVGGGGYKEIISKSLEEGLGLIHPGEGPPKPRPPGAQGRTPESSSGGGGWGEEKREGKSGWL